MKSPYELYRAINPQFFSDTVVTYKAELTKEIFRNEMDKLSYDMKQDLFENFATSLALRFITPNIVPQTGPTGGGDGKTDSETHPVNDKIAEKWYVADCGCRCNEKWAFAMSCKADWKGKVKRDVKEIVNLGRGFTKIFFFSNRQIRSADRKKTEKDLKNEYGIDVIILDQEWFVLKVFENQCIDVAVKELALSQQYTEIKDVGPNDLQRQRRLVEVEEKIANNTSEDCLDTEYVDLVTESAFLSRALEHSPSIIRGKFVRAENICKQYGTKQQLFNVIWQRGWTEFFWLENPDESYNCYLKLKSMIDEDINVNRLESIVSLYSVLSCASSLSLFKQIINLKEEENFFKNLYRTLEKDNDRHSSFLYLKICFLEKRIIQFINDKETLNGLLVKLADAFDQAASFVDISLETQFAELDMISLVVPDNDMFDYIIDHLSDLLLLRDHEISAAQLEMKRGSQLLLGGYLGKAIEHLGKCVYLFGKEPTKSEYITACCTLGDAYMGMDLLYSSKVMFTKAVAMILYNIQTSQSPNRLLIVILTKLCYLSLRSGQIVNFLMAFESWTIFEKYSPSYQDHDFLTEMGRDGRRLAARFLSCSVEDKSYSKLPAVLQRLGMLVPVDVLFYKLGYPECFTDYFRKNMQDRPDWEDKMRKFIYDPLFLFANSISDHRTQLESLICGCRFIATFESDRILQVYSELLLAFMESVISTSNCDDIIISTSQIHFEVVKTNHGETEICKGLSHEDYIFKVNYLTINGIEAWKAFVSFLSLFFNQNVRSISMGQLFADKQKMEKLLNRLYVMMTYEDEVYALYGEEYKNTIEMWVAPEDKCYPFKGKKELSNPFEKKRGVQAKAIK